MPQTVVVDSHEDSAPQPKNFLTRRSSKYGGWRRRWALSKFTMPAEAITTFEHFVKAVQPRCRFLPAFAASRAGYRLLHHVSVRSWPGAGLDDLSQPADLSGEEWHGGAPRDGQRAFDGTDRRRTAGQPRLERRRRGRLPMGRPNRPSRR